jgi:hypothetical protein
MARAASSQTATSITQSPQPRPDETASAPGNNPLAALSALSAIPAIPAIFSGRAEGEGDGEGDGADEEEEEEEELTVVGPTD